MSQIEMGKKYKTRSGREARVLCIDFTGGPETVVACVKHSDGLEWIHTYRSNGTYLPNNETSDLDLIEDKPRIKREYWLNIYRTFSSIPYGSKDTADACALDHRIACVPITIDCEHGEGLE